jgi:hypothetical protein
MIVCKYKFDKSVYENLIPEFNSGYTGYIVSDEIDSENNNYVIRTIECNTLPTFMRFGSMTESSMTNGANSLLELLYADAQNLTDMTGFIRLCHSLTQANIVNVTSNVSPSAGAVFTEKLPSETAVPSAYVTATSLLKERPASILSCMM